MIASLVLSLVASQAGIDAPREVELVPSPRFIEVRSSVLTLGAEVRVVIEDASLRPQAELLGDQFARLFELPVAIGSPPPGRSPDVRLRLLESADSEVSAETFTIEVRADGVEVAGATSQAVARGIARLLQIVEREGDAWVLPGLLMEDAPAYPWRGLMLDLARFPHPVEAVEEALELAFLFSLNVVHLHLSDDQAFTFPATCLPPRTPAGVPGADRGYTRAQLEHLVAFAEARGIMLVPEIDMPSHSSALVDARPDLFGTRNPTTGEHESTGVVNIVSRAAYESMRELIREVAAVFRTSRFFHLGGDEVWAPHLVELPEFAAFAAEHDLPVRAEEGAVAALLNHFLSEMASEARELDLQPIVWEGFRLDPRFPVLSPDVRVMSWSQASQTPESLVAAGHEVINCNWDPLYVVPAQGWAASPRAAFDWTPLELRQRFGGRTTRLEESAPLRGAQLCMWEQRPEAIVPSLLRILPELSERMWGSGHAPGSHAGFLHRAVRTRDLALALLRPVAFASEGALGRFGTAFQDEVHVRLSPRNEAWSGTLRYELSPGFGATLGPASPVFGEEPITLDESLVVTAARFGDDGRQVGPASAVRFERGSPLFTFRAFELPAGGVFEPDAFDALGDRDEALIGTGWLIHSSEARLSAINRELFARVRPEAHVDLRPLAWDTLLPAQRVDPWRPRLWGRHAIFAEGQLTVPSSGLWKVTMHSRGGVARLRIGGLQVLTVAGDTPAEASGQLEAGTYALEIEHAVLDVHNDLQLFVTRAPRTDPEPLTRFALPVSERIPDEELRILREFGAPTRER